MCFEQYFQHLKSLNTQNSKNTSITIKTYIYTVCLLNMYVEQIIRTYIKIYKLQSRITKLNLRLNMCFEQYSFQHLKSLNTSQNSNLNTSKINTSNAHLHQDLHLHNQELQFKYSYTLEHN